MTIKPALLALLLCSVTISSAVAHGAATGIVKERMEAMEDIAGRMKAVAAMIRGQRGLDAGEVAAAGQAIARHAGALPGMFPEGSTTPPSEALPAVWIDWDRFASLMGQMEQRALALAEVGTVAEETAELTPAFRSLGQTCSSCHEDFRQSD